MRDIAMKRILKQALFIFKDQKGMALFTAIVVLGILTVMGLAGIYLSTTDLMISQNYRIIKQKFFTADAALEQGINILRSTSIDDWSNLINGATQSDPKVVLSGMSDISFYGMTYTIWVKNNLNDPVFMDANYTVNEQYSKDTDDILILIAESKAKRGEPKVIETSIQWEPDPEHTYGGKDLTTENSNVVEATMDW
jgi:hypothetical protein